MRKVRPVKYVLRDFIRIFMVHVCNVMEKVTFFAHFSRDLSSKSLESAEKRKRVTTGSISFLTVVQNQFRERKSWRSQENSYWTGTVFCLITYDLALHKSSAWSFIVDARIGYLLFNSLSIYLCLISLFYRFKRHEIS